jgi:CRISPR/Cas system-associated endonuclease Cas1
VAANPRNNPARLQTLLGLWRGDEDSTGYETWHLAYAICDELRPTTIDFLVSNLWPQGKPDDETRLELAGRAFKWWEARKKHEAALARAIQDDAA